MPRKKKDPTVLDQTGISKRKKAILANIAKANKKRR